jgi:hypothetical protein
MSFGIAGSTHPVTFVNTCDAPWPVVRAVTYYGMLASALVVIGRRAFFVALNAFGMGVQVAHLEDD